MKCGSGSLNQLFSRHENPTHFLRVDSAVEPALTWSNRVQQVCTCHGEPPFILTGHHPIMPPELYDFRVFTTLRRPEQRVRSLAAHEGVTHFREWLDTMGDDHPYLHNVMVRQLSNRTMWYPWEGNSKDLYSPITKKDFYRAAANIKAILGNGGMVGLVEEFGDFQERVEDIMGWPRTETVWDNKSKDRFEMSRALRQRVNRANHWDVKLWKWAAEKLGYMHLLAQEPRGL